MTMMKILAEFARQDRRTRATICVSAAWLATALFPPFAMFTASLKVHIGYGFLLIGRDGEYGSGYGTVDFGLLLIEWVVIASLGVSYWLWRPQGAEKM